MNYAKLSFVAALFAFLLALSPSEAQACSSDQPCQGFGQFICLIECDFCTVAGPTGPCWGGICSWVGVNWQYVRTDGPGSGECYVCASNESVECIWE